MTRRSGWTVPALADAYLAGGARFIQIRSKHAASGPFLGMCEDVVTRAHKAGAMVIVNDRADIAKLSAADGVHVGQDDLDPASVRRILGGAAIVGVSTHSPDQVRAASALAGRLYCGRADLRHLDKGNGIPRRGHDVRERGRKDS